MLCELVGDRSVVSESRKDEATVTPKDGQDVIREAPAYTYTHPHTHLLSSTTNMITLLVSQCNIGLSREGDPESG
jgi:hypothetical protein